jgi:aryl-alcohol dehydrogenase-like predicted oxidoreductase
VKYRTLGKTNLNVSEISFGAWGIGGGMWKGSDDAESMRTLHRAVDLGVNFIDTALAYGRGHSEQLIGKLLKERKERLHVATKIPPKNQLWPAKAGSSVGDAFPKNYIIECTEKSLKNLGTECLDVQQFHVWLDEWLHEGDWWEAIQKLKEQGKITAFGVSINDHAPETALEFVKSGLADTVQVIYNIFDQSPEEKLFPLCKEKNVGVIVRVPFDEGGLTGNITSETTFPERDWRNRYFRDDRKKQVWEKAQELQKLLNGETKSLPELALRFCLSHPAVSTIIPGMRTVDHVESNIAVSDGRLLSDSLRAGLKHHTWQRNFY